MSEVATAPVSSNGTEIVGRYKEKLAGYGKQITELTEKLAKAESRAQKAEKAYDGDAIRAENAALKQTIRTSTHREKFRALAKEAGAADDAVDDLFDASGWKAEKDEIDEEAMKALVGDLKPKKAWAFRSAEAADDGGDQTAEPVIKRVPAGDRGTAHNPAKGGIRLTAANLADPKFMLDPRNKEMIQAAAKEHRIALPDREAQ